MKIRVTIDIPDEQLEGVKARFGGPFVRGQIRKSDKYWKIGLRKSVQAYATGGWLGFCPHCGEGMCVSRFMDDYQGNPIIPRLYGDGKPHCPQFCALRLVYESFKNDDGSSPSGLDEKVYAKVTAAY